MIHQKTGFKQAADILTNKSAWLEDVQAFEAH
jgi:hypothetical protein